MASEIQIRGPLKFIGYVQTNRAGTNGQLLTYRNGEADWADPDVDSVVTSTRNSSPAIDTKGNLITADEGTYDGIDTRPPEAEDRGSVISVNDVEVEDPNFVDGDNTTLVVTGNDVAINVPDATGGHVIQDTAGTSFPQRENLQFVGRSVSVVDVSTSDTTQVQVEQVGAEILSVTTNASDLVLRLGGTTIGPTPSQLDTDQVVGPIFKIGDEILYFGDTDSGNIYRYNFITEVKTTLVDQTRQIGAMTVNPLDPNDVYYAGSSFIESRINNQTASGTIDGASYTITNTGNEEQLAFVNDVIYLPINVDNPNTNSQFYSISKDFSNNDEPTLLLSDTQISSQTGGYELARIIGVVSGDRILCEMNTATFELAYSFYDVATNVFSNVILPPEEVPFSSFFLDRETSNLYSLDGDFFYKWDITANPFTVVQIGEAPTNFTYDAFALYSNERVVIGGGRASSGLNTLNRNSITGGDVNDNAILSSCGKWQNIITESTPPVDYEVNSGLATFSESTSVILTANFDVTNAGTYRTDGVITAGFRIRNGTTIIDVGTKTIPNTVGTHTVTLNAIRDIPRGADVCVFFTIEDSSPAQTTNFTVSLDTDGSFFINALGGVARLGELEDVVNTVTDNATEGELLTFNETLGQWENREPNANIRAARFEFNNTDDWTQQGTSNRYTIDFIHNLNSNDLFWNILDTTGTGVQLNAEPQSNVRLRITLIDNERFAGRILIERI